jgi:uncharacterized membrane protein YgdD (TMEM256/DUF423 family)
MSIHINDNAQTSKAWLISGSFISVLSVIIGAFAAHALKARLSDYQLGIVDTAAQYQMYHGLAILIASTLFLVISTPSKKIHLVNGAFAIGCVLFSGSLYCLAVSGIKIFAYFTPLGGLSFIIGWCLLIWVIYTNPKQIKSAE